MNSATLFKISFSQDKKTKPFFLRFDIYIYTIIYLQYIQYIATKFMIKMLITFSKKNNAIGEPTSQVITNWDTTKGTTLSQRGARRDKSPWTEV